MNILHQLLLALVSSTQPPKMNLHEFLRSINPPRIGQSIEVRLKDSDEELIYGILRNRTENKYALETDENLMRIIHILDIDSVTNI